MAGVARMAAGLAVAVAAGYLFSRLGTPIPWMLGPLTTVALLRVLGLPIDAPAGARQFGQWVIGTSLGLYFTPQVVRDVAGWWPLLVAGALFALAGGYGGGARLGALRPPARRPARAARRHRLRRADALAHGLGQLR